MNDIQDTDMRALLSRAAPAPEEEPLARDVVGPAMAWGERRRRGDRLLMATGAVLAVVAVGAGATSLAKGWGRGTAFIPAGPGSSATATGPEACTLPDGKAGSKRFCMVSADLEHFDTVFATGAVGYVQAKLPAGVTVADTGTNYLKLTKGGVTEFLHPSLAPPNTLDGGREHCRSANCRLVNVADGTAALDAFDGDVRADWAPAVGPGPRITLLLATTTPLLAIGDSGPSSPGAPISGAPSSPPAVSGATSPAGIPVSSPSGGSAAPKLLTAQQLADIIGDPSFRQYAYQRYNQMLQIQQEYQLLMASELPSTPGGYVSGSIPAGPYGTPSGLASPPTVPMTPSGSMGSAALPGTPSGPTSALSFPPASVYSSQSACPLDQYALCVTLPTGSAPSNPLPSTPHR